MVILIVYPPPRALCLELAASPETSTISFNLANMMPFSHLFIFLFAYVPPKSIG